ncbi:hypothetical protein [Paenibacillus dokdonensis]|uniref:hypothetical protein n=1 Tax=Paenibacillus dokdonensis TaxID=2567944 RepID=UPI001457A70C|nr:hypothetical protein [Paenibacillus dokdonensis]
MAAALREEHFALGESKAIYFVRAHPIRSRSVSSQDEITGEGTFGVMKKVVR